MTNHNLLEEDEYLFKIVDYLNRNGGEKKLKKIYTDYFNLDYCPIELVDALTKLEIHNYIFQKEMKSGEIYYILTGQGLKALLFYYHNKNLDVTKEVLMV